jgi:hypothetical protein
MDNRGAIALEWTGLDGFGIDMLAKSARTLATTGLSMGFSPISFQCGNAGGLRSQAPCNSFWLSGDQ